MTLTRLLLFILLKPFLTGVIRFFKVTNEVLYMVQLCVVVSAPCWVASDEGLF